jgi:hypothetical protein
MCSDNPLWGAPRIHGELLKLGFDISQSTVSKYMPRRSRDPDQNWKTFLRNHMDCTASIDFLVVPTITFKLLFVLIVLSHERRRAVHFGITANPTAEWTARQMTEAFPWDTAPRFLIRDRHRTYGRTFRDHVAAMAITEVPTAPRSPWQNGHVERVIGSVRRECLDHVIALNDRQLKRVLKSYLAYYNQTRTHLALDKDAPKPRSPANTNDGPIVAPLRTPGRIVEDAGPVTVRLRRGFGATYRHCLRAGRALTTCIGALGQIIKSPPPWKIEDKAQICPVGIVAASGI